MNDKYVDEVSELAYYGFRYYDKTSMTWTQSDPLYRFAPDAAWSDPRRASLYTSFLNSPLRYLDPDGRYNLGGGDFQAAKALAEVATAAAETFMEEAPSPSPLAKGVAIVAAAVYVGATVLGPAAELADSTGALNALPSPQSLGTWMAEKYVPPNPSAGGADSTRPATETQPEAPVPEAASGGATLGPNGGGRPPDHQTIVQQRLDARAEQREKKSREKNGQNLKGEGHRNLRDASKGKRGTRPKTLRQNAQDQDQQREKTSGSTRNIAACLKDPIGAGGSSGSLASAAFRQPLATMSK